MCKKKSPEYFLSSCCLYILAFPYFRLRSDDLTSPFPYSFVSLFIKVTSVHLAFISSAKLFTLLICQLTDASDVSSSLSTNQRNLHINHFHPTFATSITSLAIIPGRSLSFPSVTSPSLNYETLAFFFLSLMKRQSTLFITLDPALRSHRRLDPSPSDQGDRLP